MKSITRQKPFEEILGQLDSLDKVFIIGCGTCTTMSKTGGRDEVIELKQNLQNEGKLITGWMVVPTACDEMTEINVEEYHEAIKSADPGTYDEIITRSLNLIKVALNNSVVGPLEVIADKVGVET